MADYGRFAPAQIDFSQIDPLGSYEKGAAFSRQNALRNLMGTEEAQDMIKQGNFRGLAALAYKIDPAYGQKILAEDTQARFGMGAPIYTKGPDGKLHAYQPSGQGGMQELRPGEGESFVPNQFKEVDAGDRSYIIDPRTNQIIQVIPHSGQPEPGTLSANPNPWTPPPNWPNQQPQAAPLAPGQQPPPTAAPTPLAAQPEFGGVTQPQPQAAPPPQGVGGDVYAPPQQAVQPPFGGVVGAPGSKKAQELEQVPRAKKAISENIGKIGSLYARLVQNGGIKTSIPGGSMENAAISLATSELGQKAGRFFGTQNQSDRETIKTLIPGLIANMRQATGLSARSLDLNIELQFYKAQASDPDLDIDTNLAALEAFDRALGAYTGGGSTLDKYVPPELMQHMRGRTQLIPPKDLGELAKKYPKEAEDTLRAMEEGGPEPQSQAPSPQGGGIIDFREYDPRR